MEGSVESSSAALGTAATVAAVRLLGGSPATVPGGAIDGTGSVSIVCEAAAV